MKQRGLAVVVLIVVAIAGFWWWSHRGTADPVATPAPAPGSGSATIAPRAPDVHELAHVAIAVSDDKGPLPGATVRLAPDDGDVIVVRTGGDGIAHAELAAGAWRASASAADHEPGAVPARKLSAGEHVDLAIRLAAGGRLLTGLVSDATGGPISGVRIDAARLGSGARPEGAVATTLTGADGRYQLTVGAGKMLVGASHADYAPQSRYVEVAAAGVTADFSLVPGGVIEGVVRDARDKQPVAGAEVTVEHQGGSMFLAEASRRAATSGADGRFRITGLRPGAYEIGASEHQRVARPPTHVGLGVAEQVTDVEILIAAVPVIRGVVVDDTGAPAAGATVVANSADGAGNDGTAAADGTFTLEGLHPGRWVLSGRGDNFVGETSAQVELANQDVDHVRVVVRRGAKLVGHVEPRQICDVAIELEGALGHDRAPPGLTTAADGEFSISPLAPGKATLTGHCAGGDQGTLGVAIPGADVVLRVSPGASIAGRVVDGEGKPVANVTVMGTLDGDTEHTTIVNGMITSGAQGLTGASGAFELRGLAAGTYKLGVLDHGHPMRPRGKAVAVTLAATEHKTGVELAVDRANGKIEGTVTGPDGKPLADAWVSARQSVDQMMAALMGDPAAGGSQSRMMTIENRDDDGTATDAPPVLTDASGHFAITGLPHEHFTVVAEAQANSVQCPGGHAPACAPGALRGRVPDVAPDATIAIQALGLATLHGTVHGATVPELFTVELDGPTQGQRSFANATGTFDYSHVDPGAYTVKVTSSAGNGQATVTVVAGQPATVDVTLVENALVTGKLVDPAGHPLANLPVVVIADQGTGAARVSLSAPPPVSAADGSFRVEAPAGKSMLLVMLQPRPFHRAGLLLEAGKTTDLGAVTVTP